MIQKILLLLVDAATSLFEVILMVTFFNGFLEEKELSLGKKAITVCAAALLVFSGSLFFAEVPFAVMLNFFAVSVICSYILYNGKFFYRLFSCVLLLAILLVVELLTVTVLISGLKLGNGVIQSDPLFKGICIVVKNVISFVVIRIICYFRKSSIREAARVYTVFLLVVPVFSIMVSIIVFELALHSKVSDISSILMAFLGLMYMNAIVFWLFESMMRHFDKEYKYQMIERQLELQINHYNKLAESREILSEVVHDFKNHLNCIYNLYKYNKGPELGKYIENLINVSDTEKIIDTGNPVIDALLNDKSNIARKHGISFRQMLNLPSNINVAYNDICAILGNSLDNAIEACRNIENSSLNKEIELSMNYRDSYLIIVVKNTFDKPPMREGRFFRSSKESPGLHGLGMQSMERTVKKYNGNMVVKHDDTHFSVEIVMSIA